MTQLNVESFNEFCDSWIRKAHETDTHSLAGVFDRFFTLWVVFNRLYEEAARSLVRAKHPIAAKFRMQGNRQYAPPPDRTAATKGVIAFCGLNNLRGYLFGCRNTGSAVEYICDLIIGGSFYLHENYENGGPDSRKDFSLATKARNGCLESTLSLVYQARCNLFHGQKLFSEVQRDLLMSMSLIIEQTILCLRLKFEHER